jgi:hypothetical protein
MTDTHFVSALKVKGIQVASQTDGTAWTIGKCKFRVSPGSDWLENASYLRMAYRDLGRPDEKNHFTGFRIARALNGHEAAGHRVVREPGDLGIRFWRRKAAIRIGG